MELFHLSTSSEFNSPHTYIFSHRVAGGALSSVLRTCPTAKIQDGALDTFMRFHETPTVCPQNLSSFSGERLGATIRATLLKF